MIPFLIPLALKLSPVGRFLKSIPPKVWIALAVLAALGLGAWMHGRAVKSAYTKAYSAGVTYEAARIEAKAKKLADRATAIAAKLKEQNNVENRRIAGDADAIRLRGPGKAACLNPAIPGTSRRESPARPGDAAVGQLPDRERVEFIALPFAGTIAFAERCDLNRAEALTWREDKRLQTEAWQRQQ